MRAAFPMALPFKKPANLLMPLWRAGSTSSISCIITYGGPERVVCWNISTNKSHWDKIILMPVY